MESQDKLFDCFEQYKSMAESHFGRKMSSLRCDNGGGYVSPKWKIVFWKA